MPFAPGKSPNPSGRPSGVANKITQDMREKIRDRVSIDGLFADIEAISDPYDRAMATLKVLQFVLPTMRSIEINEVPLLVDIARMSPTERKAKLMELIHAQKTEAQ